VIGLLRSRKGLGALCIVCVLYGWSLLTAFGVFGASQLPSGGATASADEYQYSNGSVNGSGQILKSVDFEFTAKGDTGGVRGTCTVVEKKANQVSCRTVTSLVVVGNHATFSGQATHNGALTTYTIEMDDLAEPGRGSDMFSITTGSGFSRSGVVTSGNLQVRS